MKLNCTTNAYDVLYTRWLDKPHVLLDMAKYKPTENLLDLCGGSGVVSREAVRRGGTRVALLDLNPRCHEDGVRQIKGDASQLLRYFIRGSYDLIVCRQAVGYLDVATVFPQVGTLLRPNGRFVFNMFRQPPRWAFKRYDHKGRRFTEASVTAFGKVLHAQIAHGVGWDMTLFHNHDDAVLLRSLVPWADIKIDLRNRSAYWLCTRRP